MHRLGDPMPRLHLLTAVDAGSPGVALALHGHLRCLAHDQLRGLALRVIAGGEGAWHITRLAGSRAGQWRHDDAMRQVKGAKPERLEQPGPAWRPASTRGARKSGCFLSRL